jgi:hypothetical protein
MKNALLKTFILATAATAIVSLTGCRDANSTPSDTAPAANAVANSASAAPANANVNAPVAADANERKAEADKEIY